MPSTAVEMPRFSEKKFQAEDDARTLQRAAEVMQDKKRLTSAKKEIEAQKKQLEQAGQMAGSRNLQGDSIHKEF